MARGSKMQKWSQDQAVAFECAHECIVDLMGICSAELADLEGAADGCADHAERIERRMADLAAELRRLHVTDTDHIERVRLDYGQEIRAYRATAITQD